MPLKNVERKLRVTTDISEWDKKRQGDVFLWTLSKPLRKELVLSKADLIHNKPDGTGWRKPSRYHRHTGVEFYGHVQGGVTETYPEFTWTGRRYRIDSGLWGSHGISSDFYIRPSRPAMFQLSHAELLSKISWQQEQEARVKAIASLANRKGKVLESLAELRSTFAGLGGNARELAWFVENHVDEAALRKKYDLPKKHAVMKRWRKIAATSKSAAEFFSKQWLNFWFGLSPVVDDMVFAMTIVGNPEMYKRLRVKGVGHSWDIEKFDILKTSNPTYAHIVPTHMCRLKFDLKYGVRISAYYEIKSELWRQATAYGSIDVASTVWAVSPASWMVDWMIPVTKLLESYEGLHGLSYKGASITRYYEVGDPKITDVSIENGYLGRVDPIMVGGSGFTRDVVLPFGMLPAPYIKDPFSAWTATTGLAYLTTKMKSILGETETRARLGIPLY